MAKRNEGWTVARHEQSNTVLLLQGERVPWGYTFLAWTAGSKRDGRELLAEVTQLHMGTHPRQKEAR